MIIISALISIIVPVYNTEKFLRNCLDSLVNQTYPNLEIILVDDGSTDSCCKILDEYSSKYSYIKVLCKENGGVSSARNMGLAHAKGDYIFFVDSDDYISPDCIEILYKVAIDKGCEIVQSKYRRVEAGSEEMKLEESNREYNVKIYNKDDAEWALQSGVSGVMGMVWAKLYRRHCFTNITFPENKIHEDEMVMHYLLYTVNNFAVVDLQLYHYVMSSDSIMRSKFTLKKYDIIEALEDRYRFYKSVDLNDCALITAQRLGGAIIDLYRKTKESFPEATEQLACLMKLYPEVLDRFINSPYMNEELRAKHLLWIDHPEEGEWYWMMNHMRSIKGEKIVSAAG